jgi:hypothetical protein
LRHIKECDESSNKEGYEKQIRDMEIKQIKLEAELKIKDVENDKNRIKLEAELKLKDVENDKNKIKFEAELKLKDGEQIRMLANQENMKVAQELQIKLAISETTVRLNNMQKEYKNMHPIAYLSTFFNNVPNFIESNIKELTFDMIKEAARLAKYKGIKYLAKELFLKVEKTKRNIYSSDIARSKYLIFQEEIWKDDIDGIIFITVFFGYLGKKIAEYIAHLTILILNSISPAEKEDLSKILITVQELMIYIKDTKKEKTCASMLCSSFKLVKDDPNTIETLKITEVAPIDVSDTSRLLTDSRKVPVVDPDPNGEKEYDYQEEARIAKQAAEKEKRASKGKEAIVEESEEDKDTYEKAYSSDESEDNVPVPVVKK